MAAAEEVEVELDLAAVAATETDCTIDRIVPWPDESGAAIPGTVHILSIDVAARSMGFADLLVARVGSNIALSIRALEIIDCVTEAHYGCAVDRVPGGIPTVANCVINSLRARTEAARAADPPITSIAIEEQPRGKSARNTALQFAIHGHMIGAFPDTPVYIVNAKTKLCERGPEDAPRSSSKEDRYAANKRYAVKRLRELLERSGYGDVKEAVRATHDDAGDALLQGLYLGVAELDVSPQERLTQWSRACAASVRRAPRNSKRKTGVKFI